jgi:hypothetical protein
MEKQNSGIRAFFSKDTTQERVGHDKLVEERRAERQQRFQESHELLRYHEYLLCLSPLLIMKMDFYSKYN